MSRPEDIPQDVWDAAVGIRISYSMPDPWMDRTLIARAILAAKAEEREACAALVEDQDSWTSRFETSAAIRKRGEA